MTRAAVTGAGGFLGGNLAAQLLDEGIEVTATRRASTRVDHLADLQIRWMEADLTPAAGANVDGLARAFDGVDVVFHCAAAASQTRRLEGPHRTANVSGTKAVLAAAKKAGVPRLVHVSSVVTCSIARPGGPDATEDDPWNFPEHGLDDVYAVTKREAEAAVLRPDAGQDAEQDVVVVNPALMLGPRDAKPSSGKLILEIAAGRIVGFPSGANCFVDVRDVCRGMIAAWRQGRRGERYILGGVNISYQDAFTLIAEELGRPPPRVRLPDALVRLTGSLGDLGECLLGRELTLNSSITTYATEANYRFSSQKAMRELGHSLTPLRTTVKDAIAWFRGRGML